MFSHFIYFIIALLILSLYEAPETLPFNFSQAFLLFIGLGMIYGWYTHQVFNRLIKRMEWESQAKLDHDFSQYSTRCSVLALVMLAADIWWLHLPAYLDDLKIFSLFPTLSSLLLLLLFICYLTLMWVFSFRAHRAIYRTDISFGNYIYSNVAFSIPVLIPWALLFGIHDLIRLLPFQLPQRILDTPIGQTSYFLIFLIITAIFAPVLIQRFWRCHSMEAGEQRSRIEKLCRKTGVRYADIVYWPIFGGRMITAGVMGLVSRFRYILVTDALLSMLTPDEVDQVIAHEIGHVKHRHLLLYLLFFFGFMLVTHIVIAASNLFIFSREPILQAIEAIQFNPLKVRDVFLVICLILCVVLYFRFIFGYFIRNFERQADLYVFGLFPSARPLISTFDKIVAGSGQPADKPNWHHFSIKQRIEFLWRCEQSRQWIKRHNKKVLNSIIAFVACLLVLGVASFHLHKSTLEKNQSLFFAILGDKLIDKNKLEEAAKAYENALSIKPDNPHTLNNLAWILATATDKALYDPPRALELAQKAITLNKEPHIWDTLAESLFVNGRIEEAIEAERRALEMNPKDRKIYEVQLTKFENALKQNRFGGDPIK
jgi:Zn-dependent protease with chaperone function